ncbi:MAG: hypothetical protein DSY91_07830 [Deltaproteobacteria bacterium]|nr:MAG: hypothetical protein DSY91_07830 [Deltaproteobacteria bacterium]
MEESGHAGWRRFIPWGLVLLLSLLTPGINAHAADPVLNSQLLNIYKTILQGPGVFSHGSRKLSPPGIAITTDLCPSTKAWNRGLYEKLVALGEKLHKPLPVGIAVSGRWMERYPQALAQLIKWDKEGKLAITWINHSDTHPVRGNFLVNPKVDFTKEVENQVARMRRAGIFNSRYFRFPGLVFDFARLRQLSTMGYVAVGADAWLAKGQRVRNGSIILVHGNGNEKMGVWILDAYLKLKEGDFVSGKLRILSLNALLLESAKAEPELQFISWIQPKSR